MANAQVQFRIDEAVQRKASELCGRLGLDLTDYVRLGMNRMKQTGGVSFESRASFWGADEDSPLLEAMHECSHIAEANGIADMTLEEIDAEIAAARAEMRAKEAAKGLAAMERMSCSAERHGTADMTLEEINAEIAAARAEKN